MDFIQSAIERAREERQRRGPPAATGPQPDAGTAPEAPEASAAPDRAALWAALPAFTPRPAHLDRHRILAHRTGPEAAHFDMMRTKLLHQMRANNWRRVAITSPGSACGKTMLALNLAFSLARQAELATMAIELDMRRPSMARVMGLSDPCQFSQVLAGKAAPEAHLHRIGRNLAVGCNRAAVADPAELLQAVTAGRAMDAVEAAYAPDVVILDMPPMLVADDTLAFIDQIDCVLLVAAAERSSMAEIERCAADLAARCNFLGVVLNKCRYLDSAEGYGYGYGRYGS